MARLHRIAIAILTLDAVLTASAALASPQSPPGSGSTTTLPAVRPPVRGRIVTDAQRLSWLATVADSWLGPYLTNVRMGDRGIYAQARDVDALITGLNRQLFDGVRGIFRIGWLHQEHKDVGPRRLDYRTDRGAFGDGSLQVVVSRVTGMVFIDMDEFSPYEDVWSFFGHSWEVVRNRWGIRR